MEDYDMKYEAYRKELLESPYFINSLKKKYENTMYAEKDYIDNNGVLWKSGILAAVCGLCLGISMLVEPSDSVGYIVVRFILLTIGLSSFLWAAHIGVKFKQASGNSSFISYQYARHIKDYVLSEKSREAERLIWDLFNVIDNVQYRAELMLDKKPESKELEDNLLYFVRNVPELQKRYDALHLYDRFAEDLLTDYYFAQAMQNEIEQ